MIRLYKQTKKKEKNKQKKQKRICQKLTDRYGCESILLFEHIILRSEHFYIIILW